MPDEDEAGPGTLEEFISDNPEPEGSDDTTEPDESEEVSDAGESEATEGDSPSQEEDSTPPPADEPKPEPEPLTYPKPTTFDPQNLTTDEGREVQKHWQAAISVKGQENKQALDELKASYGDVDPETVKRNAEILEMFNNSPDFAAARAIVRGDADPQYVRMAHALVDPTHPDHLKVTRQVQAERAGVDQDEQLLSAIASEDGTTVDPRKLEAYIQTKVAEAAQVVAPVAQPQPQGDPWTDLATKSGVNLADKAVYNRIYASDGAPEFQTEAQALAYMANVKKRVETDRENAYATELKRAANDSQPRPRGPGNRGHETELDLAGKSLEEIHILEGEGKLR